MSDKQNFAKSATLGVAGTKHHGVELSDMLYEHPKTLKPHPENATLFQEQDELYFNRLRDDVRERGILVPLQVKPDKTLLAGHNRLRVALELGLERVPVQYVEDTLSPEQEREFLIKDNLLRRHLSGQECIELYRKMYPNFDERIREKAVGRKAQTEEPAPQPEEQKPLTAREIAAATGQKERTVQHQLQQHRKREGLAPAPQPSEEKAASTPQKKYSLDHITNDIRFGFGRIYTALQDWEATNPSEADCQAVYTTLQKKVDELQEQLTMRQEVQP